jgi:hypothetical protein
MSDTAFRLALVSLSFAAAVGCSPSPTASLPPAPDAPVVKPKPATPADEAREEVVSWLEDMKNGREGLGYWHEHAPGTSHLHERILAIRSYQIVSAEHKGWVTGSFFKENADGTFALQEVRQQVAHVVARVDHSNAAGINVTNDWHVELRREDPTGSWKLYVIGK